MKSPIEKKLRDELRAGYPGIRLTDVTEAPNRITVVVREDRLFVDIEEREQDVTEFSVERFVESDELYAEVLMFSNVHILSYRADLFLECNGHYLTVECDGHEWHERTKQQAAYDRSRDRELLKLGIETVRFTGSEIVHSPERCAGDVWDVIKMFDRRSTADQFAFFRGAAIAKKQALKDIAGPGAMVGVL